MKHIFSILLVYSLQSCNHIDIIHPVQKDILETVYASGKIGSVDEHWLSCQTNGRILKKMVRNGDVVRKGQPLYIIENKIAQEKYAVAVQNYNHSVVNLSENSPVLKDLLFAISSAEIKVKNDSTNYLRWKLLWEQNIGTKSNLEDAYTKFKEASNLKEVATQKYYATMNDLQISHKNAFLQLQMARKELSDVYILSDMDGMVFDALKEAGESVSANQALLLIGSHRDRQIHLYVDQQDIDKVQLGQKVLLEIDAKPTHIYEARVSHIYSVMNEADQTFRVDASFEGNQSDIFIHHPLEANIITEERKNALTVPREVFDGKDSVWLSDNGKRKKIHVSTGISTLDYVEVLSGVSESSRIISNWNNFR